MRSDTPTARPSPTDPPSPCDDPARDDTAAPRAPSAHAPFVSVVMPVRDEARHLARSLGSVLAQDWPPERLEVLVVDGRSTDGTADLARRLAGDAASRGPSPAVRVLDNPDRHAAAAMNAGLRAARGDVIVRIDGHAEVPPDFVRRCVETLLASGADVAGGALDTRAPEGSGAAGRAVAVAMSSKFGAGGAAFRTGARRVRDVDTLAFGAYRRSTLDRLGGFDASFPRNQDDELHLRLVRAGGRIVLDPRVRAVYRCRPHPLAAARQYFGYGFHKARLLRLHGRLPSPRALAPAALVAALAAATVVATARGDPRALLAVGGVYAVATVVASVVALRRCGWAALPWLPVAYAALHLGYGAGFLVGLAVAIVRPPRPRVPPPRDRGAAERARLRSTYARRDADPAATARDAEDDPGTAWLVADRARRLRDVVAREGVDLVGRGPLLDIGCGRAASLALLRDLAADATARLVGVDALPERLAAGRDAASAASASLAAGEASRLPFRDGAFEGVLLATSMSSVHDPEVRRRAAREAVRVLRPGGALLWYDLRVRGRADRGIAASQIRRLFPGCRVAFARAGLVPPLARAAARVSPRLCDALALLPPLRSHLVAVVRRAEDVQPEVVARGAVARRALDLVIAVPALVVAAPAIAILALAVRLGSSGPAFFRAVRVGRGGATFRMTKLRTMSVGAGGPSVTSWDDARVTRVGAVLRRLHVDELPQLWDVVRGAMSLVGPRPEAPEFVDGADARWRVVLAARPGITGPTQIAFGHREGRRLRGADPAGAYRSRVLPRKLRADAAYVARRTLWSDVGCLLRTAARAVAPRRGRRS